jgi:hypothetical protein
MTNHKQTNASRMALEAGEFTFKEKATTSEAAVKYGLSRTTDQAGRLVINFGSQSDIEAIKEGRIGIATIANKIRQNLSEEDRTSLRKRKNVPQKNRHEALQTSMSLWAEFLPMLRGVTSLPDPKDMVALVRSNNARIKTTDSLLPAATAWLTEFSNEWNKQGESKSRNSDFDSGGSVQTSGSQHVKSAA